MSKITIIEGNNNDKDNVKALMVKGEKGYSAYEIAVQNGYTGTEQEWINSFINSTLYYNKTEVDGLIDNEKTLRNNADGDLQTNINNEATIRMNADNNLQSQISGLAGGSPLVASSTSEMTDTTKIYVNTTDGYWYYYNGILWVQGGVYQSTSLGVNDIYMKNLNTEVKQVFGNTETITITSGTYIDNYGVVTTAVNRAMTSPISMKEGQTIVLKAVVPTGLSAFAKVNSDNTYTNLLRGKGSSEQTYTLTVLEDCQIVCCFVDNEDYEFYNFFDYLNMINKIDKQTSQLNFLKIIPDFTITEGKYIKSSNGTIGTLANCDYSSLISLKKGEKIILKAFVGTSVSALAKYNNSLSIYENLVEGENSGEIKEYSYIATEDCQVSFTYYKDHNKFYYVYIERNLSKIINELNILPFANMFSKVTGIGDSLTWGQVYYASNHSRQALKTYPQVLTELMGNTDYDVFATKGYSASQVWNYWKNSLVDTSKSNLNIIYLGTNGGLTDTLDTDAPVTEPDYNNWADTNTGDYAKLVAKCQALGGKVLLIKIWAGGNGNVDLTNQVIEKIAERFNVPVLEPIKLTDAVYHYYPDLSGQNNLHFNDMGYSAMANEIFRRINALSDTDKVKLILNQ